jgi:uncharacterized membrane protein YfcA
MDWLDVIAIFVAGIAAGTINTIVGSGTLITFPTLLALGYPPVAANISNSVGLVPGGVSGTWGYRRELAGQGARLRRLSSASILGSVTGALVLLVLPAESFQMIVPVLLAIAVVLVLMQGRLNIAMARRRSRRVEAGMVGDPNWHRIVLLGGVYLAGVYGGYFGAAQGVLLVGLLGALLPETLQRINGAKNLLSTFVNIVAAATFAIVATTKIDWVVVLLIALGSMCGGVLGARIGRRLPPTVLRFVIVLVGVIAIVKILLPYMGAHLVPKHRLG